MFDVFEGIQRRAFPPIMFLLKSKFNRLGKRPTSAFNCSSVEVMDVDDRDNILYIQQYLLDTSTKMRAYQCPPKATQSPNTMFIWTLSRYWIRFFIVFPLGGLVIVAKETIVDGRRHELTRLASVAMLRCSWLWNCLQPKILCRVSDLNVPFFCMVPVSMKELHEEDW